MLEYEDVINYCDGEIPGYIEGVEDGKIIINYCGLFDEQEKCAIGVEDLAKFYAFEANSFKTIRSLGPMMGDHRPISNLAEELHGLFKWAVPDEYREACEEYSDLMTPTW